MKFFIHPKVKDKSAAMKLCKLVCFVRCDNVCSVQTGFKPVRQSDFWESMGCCPQGGRMPK